MYPFWLKPKWLKVIVKQAYCNLVLAEMVPMKAMKFMKTSKVMTKGALIKAIAEKHELKTKVCSGLLESLATSPPVLPWLYVVILNWLLK